MLHITLQPDGDWTCETITLPQGSGHPASSAIACGGDGTLYLLNWGAYEPVRLMKRTSNGWEEVWSDTKSAEMCNLSVDSLGRVHIVRISNNGGAYECYLTTVWANVARTESPGKVRVSFSYSKVAEVVLLGGLKPFILVSGFHNLFHAIKRGDKWYSACIPTSCCSLLSQGPGPFGCSVLTENALVYLKPER